MPDDEKPTRKRAAKASPRKAATPRPSAADRKKAAEQIASVTPIRKGGTTPTGGRSPATNRTTKPALDMFERRSRALTYRRVGLGWEEIARRVADDLKLESYAASTAASDVRAMLDSVTIEAVEGVRQEDLALLLSLQRKVYTAALDGDLAAVREMRGILADRAKYLGLYAPVRHELTGAGGGAVEFSVNDPAAIYEAAIRELGELPTPPMLELPALPSTRST